MSFEAMAWASKQDTGSSSSKLVLLMLANHANGHTGQCNPRHKMLAQVCEMTVETLKTHLKRLEAAGLIKIISQFADGVQLPNHYVLNLGGGGGNFSGEGGGKNPPPYNQEVNQELNLHHTGEATPADEYFSHFWAAYPKKVGKGAALKAWKKIKRPADTLPAILKAIESQRRSDQWCRDGGQFIPYPATYLNELRWEDEQTGTTSNRSSLFAGAI